MCAKMVVEKLIPTKSNKIVAFIDYKQNILFIKKTEEIFVPYLDGKVDPDHTFTKHYLFSGKEGVSPVYEGDKITLAFEREQ